MLAIAPVLDGVDRKAAAESCGMDRQTLREASDPAVDEVVRWRRVDLQRRIEARFGVVMRERSVGNQLAATKTGALPDHARGGQQGMLRRICAPRGSRPRAPRDTSAHIFGAVCPERPPRRDIPHRRRGRTCRFRARRRRLARVEGASLPRQHHPAAAPAIRPGDQPDRRSLGLDNLARFQAVSPDPCFIPTLCYRRDILSQGRQVFSGANIGDSHREEFFAGVSIFGDRRIIDD